MLYVDLSMHLIRNAENLRGFVVMHLVAIMQQKLMLQNEFVQNKIVSQ